LTALASPPRAASSGRIWAWVPFLLLGGLLGMQLLVLRNVERRSVALGWRAVLELQPTASPGYTRLIVRLTEHAGSPLTGAALTAQAFANARAGQVLTLRWTENAPGRYESELGPAQPGLWEIRLRATRGLDTFVQIMRPMLPRDAAP
jgi:hypothetical protein